MKVQTMYRTIFFPSIQIHLISINSNQETCILSSEVILRAPLPLLQLLSYLLTAIPVREYKKDKLYYM